MKMFIFFSILLLLSFFLTFIIRKWTIKKSLLDHPNERSSHSVPTPRGGGIAIAIAWFFTTVFLFIRKDIDSNLCFALLCGLPISVIGLADDIITISPKIRLFIQIFSASLALFFLGGINSIDIGFTILKIPILFTILSIIGIVWFTNLFNFLDGIDGYISTEVIFIGLASFIFLGLFPPIILAVITAGFLIWNWQPAKIFMGDVGSTLLGFTIGVFAVYYQNTNNVSIIFWLMLTSLFWFDASLTLFRRWRNKEDLSKAHKKHAYQRMVQSGWSHQRTVIWAFIINIPIFSLVWLGIQLPFMMLPLLGFNIIYLYSIIRVIDKRYPFY